MASRARSIVVARLEEIYNVIADAVYQTVFLRNAPRPTTCEQISQRLGLSRALERIAHHCLGQIQNSDGSAPVGFDPIPQILPELGMKDGEPLNARLHRGSLAATPLPSPVSFCAARPDAAPLAAALHSAATEAGERSRSARRVHGPERERHPGNLCAGQLRSPADPQLDRERWPGFRASSCMWFQSPSVPSFCTGFGYGSGSQNSTFGRLLCSRYQTRQGCSETIGSPALQAKASRNSGMFCSTPLARNGPGECGSVAARTRDDASVEFSHQICA
jgi:hypothetical protein